MSGFGVDRLREIAGEVGDRNITPFEAAGLIMKHRVDTPHGSQPLFLATGTVVSRIGDVYRGAVLMDCPPDTGWRLAFPTEGNGTQLAVRTTDNPIVAMLGAVSGPNVPAQRLVEGGLGVDESFDRGVVRWHTDPAAPGRTHAGIEQRVLQNLRDMDPNTTVGHVDLVGNDGSFVPLEGLEHAGGEYASFGQVDHEVVASYPVTAGALLGLAGVRPFSYPGV